MSKKKQDKTEPIGVVASTLFDSPNRKAERLMYALDHAPKGAVIEIGCARTPSELVTDGWSTIYLAERCKEEDRPFLSFDVDERAVAVCNKALLDRGLMMKAEVRDGVEGLKAYATRVAPQPLAMLYLDGADDPAETLKQFKAATFASEAVLAVDDVQMIDWDKLMGKATNLIPELDKLKIPYDVYTTEPGYSMLLARMPVMKESK